MSTHFDIGCRDCRRWLGLHNTNHRETILLWVLKNRSAFKELEALSIDWIEIDPHFLKEHDGHRLAVYCEYETFETAEQRFENGLTWGEFNRKRFA